MASFFSVRQSQPYSSEARRSYFQNLRINFRKSQVATNAVTRAVIECFDGRRWCIVLRGSDEFVLKSARQNPKAFAKIETGLDEIKGLACAMPRSILRSGTAIRPR